ncbi:TIR domain-containing protein [Virgibacillus sp. JSM 102003]|uniref:TIR domain-containing protein n=1 Tax=Virgibacillus sp. JSM 102003 TaxID=1562108 RepID=UPI0035BF028D
MYYQVLIEKKDGKKKMYELDKEEQADVIKEIVIPYLQKKDFQFDGYFLQYNTIDRIVIKETKKTTRELANYENDNMPTGLIMVVSPEDIIDYDEYAVDVTKKIFSSGKEILENCEEYTVNTKEENNPDKTKVFVVHGHDELAIKEIALFIRKLGLDPIILREQPNQGKTIIEKIEANSNVGFGVVLYTPDDVGAKKENRDELNPRARQNVIFEHGFLIGRIGRENVAALVKEELEKPNDISGVVYITMDEYERWQIELAKELKSSGYEIDMNRFFT